MSAVPRRSLDFSDYLDTARRNLRWILVPICAGLVISTVVAYLLEDTYVSQALIRIVPQQIPDNLVQNASSQQLSDHINAMAESILSRNTLTNLINTYHLYRSELKSEPLEDVINKMKTDITIRPTQGIALSGKGNLPAMQISFSYPDRMIAKSVCDDIVSRFMNQNSQESMETQQAASQFLKDEFDRARRDLDGVNGKLAAFRSANAGRLPEQMELNLQQMNSLTQRTSAMNDALNRNNGQRLLLESALRIAKDRLNAIRTFTPQSQARNEHLLELDKQIQSLQTSIEDMKDRYTDSFPDLQRARQQLSVLQRQRDVAAKDATGKATDSSSSDTNINSRERLDAQSQVDTLESQLKANAMEAQQLNKALMAANSEVRSYQGRIESVPGGERDYAELLHDRELAKQHYDDMEQKLHRASISMDMERRRQGETLEVLDAASLPVSPMAPKRALLIPLGPLAGLLIGAIIVAIRELRDSSLKTLKDAKLYTQLPVLGSIPFLESEALVQRRKQLAWITWATAGFVGLAVMATSVAHYYLTKA